MKNHLGENTAVCFTNDLWSSALTEIRLKAPLEESGFHVVQGNDFDKLLVDDLSRADFVVIQRDFPIHIDIFFHVLKQVRLNKLSLVYEIDDNLFELPMDHPDQQMGYYAGRFMPMLWAIGDADMVTASTESIADFLTPFNNNVHVLKNYLLDRYWQFSPVKRSKEKGEKVVIGYIGGTTHGSDLKMIAESLRIVGQHYRSEVQFNFWGALPPDELSSHPFVNWQPVVADYREYAAMFQTQDIDILIAPLKDSPFARSKSHLKFLEYSTLGVPAVYSDVMPFQQVVKHGENGFLAASQDEWIQYLQNLISSPSLRFKVAHAAQETVRTDWLLSVNAYRWSDRYYNLLADRAASDDKLDELREKRDGVLHRVLSVQSDQIERLMEKERILVERDRALQPITDSTSWKITSPLREFANGLRQVKRRIFRG